MPKKKCEHGIRKEYCIPCKGSEICEHNKRKARCIECKGSQICEHGIRKEYCIPCNGSGICEHNKRKVRCIECNGSGICEHNKIKARCIECNGSGICEHGIRKEYCIPCKGSEICEHNKRKARCIECKGSQICIHNKVKRRCKICGGQDLCKSEWCEVRGIPKYNGYCLNCCIHICPDIPISNNYKTKEKDTVDRIIEIFPNFTWVCDKKIKDGCSKRRPDLLLDMGSHILIVEIDENKHTDYDCSCEHKRLMELSQDNHFRPIVFIRFNPDAYKVEDKIIKSCWKVNKLGITVIRNQKEWNERIKII